MQDVLQACAGARRLVALDELLEHDRAVLERHDAGRVAQHLDVREARGRAGGRVLRGRERPAFLLLVAALCKDLVQLHRLAHLFIVRFGLIGDCVRC